MLRFLGIRHLAVIDHIELEFESGLTLLTGETGAGKSVLVDAIDLLVGGRASADLVRTGEASAMVQAVFERADGRELIVRREISAQGRSRAFIDDALATSAALKDIGRELVDLHGQHEHQTLLDPAEQRAHLDATLDDADLIQSVADAFDTWQSARVALDRSRLDDREKRARIEIATFQRQEIDKVAPVADEDVALAAERTVLANADRLLRWCSEAYAALYDGETAALSALSLVWKRLADLSSLDARFAPFLEERTGIKSSLEELAHTLRSYSSDLDASPERLQRVEDRLVALERLKKKHGPTLDDVIARRAELESELAALGAGDEHVALLEAREDEARRAFASRADALSAARQQAANRLSRALERALSELAMPGSRVDVRVTPVAGADDWSRHGSDTVEFYLSANPGEDLRPLARTASGGELSRIMLAVRTLAPTEQNGRTLIFDEVDAGIGGEAADAVGGRLQALALRHQVICITHLAQVAARPGAHLHMSKEVRGGRTHTLVSKLDDTSREMEIARMIAGAGVSPQVLASARELIAARRESEQKTKGEGAGRAKAKGRRGDA